jgi:hypothetical protein
MTQQPYDPVSDRPCRKCGHALPHNAADEHLSHICSYVETHRIAGYDCGHKRWSKRCENEYMTDGACYSFIESPCDCTENDRLVADLRARIAELEAR